MRDDTERLRDILEAIERLEKYARQGKTVFEQQELIQILYKSSRIRKSQGFSQSDKREILVKQPGHLSRVQGKMPVI